MEAGSAPRWPRRGRRILMRIVWLSSGFLLPFARVCWDVGPLLGGGGSNLVDPSHSTGGLHERPPSPTPQRVRGLMCLGIRLRSFLHVCVLRANVRAHCLPSVGGVHQTAAEGVCLASTLLSLHPAGQFKRRSLSHQVSASCHPAVSCLS